MSNFKLKGEMQINRSMCGLLNIVSLSSEMVALGYTVSNGNLQLLELARVSKVLITCESMRLTCVVIFNRNRI